MILDPTFTFDEAGHEYRLRGRVLPSITQTLKATGWINEEYYDEQGRQRGIAVHAACQYLIEGDLDWLSLASEHVGYVNGFQRFLNETGFKALVVEEKLYSEVYWFAGRPDLFGGLGAERAVIDIKTGGTGLWTALQTAGQAVLLRERLPVLEPIARYALKLTQEGNYSLEPHKSPLDMPMFLNCVAMVNRRTNGK